MFWQGIYKIYRNKFIPRIKVNPLFEKFFPLVKGDIGGQSRLSKFLSKMALKHSNYRTYPKPDGSIVEEDWDNLIILDACRHDAFKKHWDCEKRISRGTTTSEWLKNNFPDVYNDIVFVSANPHISDIGIDGFKGTDHFYHVENVWKTDWDEKNKTVPAEKVTERTVELKDEYPEKRFIIHYMQPHAPFIGKEKLDYPQKKKDSKTVFDAFALGEITKKEIVSAYEENLKYVKKEADDLVGKIKGRTLLTSDHGNSFSQPFIGHPPEIRIKQLVEVPLVAYQDK